MNNELHESEKNAWERGYGEALLDMYVFLTGNPLALDIEPDRFGRLSAMADQITQSSTGLLQEVPEPV